MCRLWAERALTTAAEGGTGTDQVPVTAGRGDFQSSLDDLAAAYIPSPYPADRDRVGAGCPVHGPDGSATSQTEQALGWRHMARASPDERSLRRPDNGAPAAARRAQ